VTIVKRSISISGHSTSISVEEAFWKGLRDIAERQETSIARLVAAIDAERDTQTNLSSAIRLFVFDDALRRAERIEDKGSSD